MNDQKEKYMRRCLDLAKLGEGRTAPNPMVGSVIVHEGKIIGEGFHQQYRASIAKGMLNCVDEKMLSEGKAIVDYCNENIKKILGF